MKARLFLTGLALITFITVSNAQKADNDIKQSNDQTWGPAFVDKNNDGICDNLVNPRSDLPPQNRNFNRSGRGYRCGRGYGYQRGNGRGQGRGIGRGQGRGQGRFYVDKNNNGICDYAETNNNTK